MKRAYIGLFALVCLIGASNIQVARAQEWKQLPLSNPVQKAAGVMGGEGMQMIQAIVYAQTNPRIVYLSSDTSQVWKSIDGGKTWMMKHKGFHAMGALSLVVDPHNENIVFASGARGTEREKLPKDIRPLHGIFRTSDGGENWELIKEMAYFGDHEGTHFAFDPTSLAEGRTKTVYAASWQDGLWKSSDGGDTWKNVGLKGTRIYDIKSAPKVPHIVLASTVDGLYRYDDKLGTATKIGNGLPEAPRSAVIDPQNPDKVFVTAGKSGVYFSDDGGNNFVVRSKGLPLGKQPYINLAISPVNPDYLYVSIGYSSVLNPFWSHDGGLTWNMPQTLNKGGMSIYGERRFFDGPIEPHPKEADTALAAANGGARILKTDDGGQTWSYSGSGYTGGRRGMGSASIGFYNDPRKMVFFLIDHGPLMTEDGGLSWRMLPIPRVIDRHTSTVGVVDPTGKSGRIVAAIGDWTKQCISVSKDDGLSWRVFDETVDRHIFMGTHPQKPDVIYGYGFKSQDAGETWKRLPKKVMAIYASDGDTVYAVDNLDNGKSALAVSKDSGMTWETPFGVLPVAAKKIYWVEVDPKNPQHIYVATREGLFIHSDGKWRTMKDDSGFAADRFGLYGVKCVIVDQKHPEIVYAGRWAPNKGHANGVFRSADRGKTWENITYNLGPEITCWSLTVSPNDGTVYFGSSHGTWTLPAPYVK
ncbi:MAG: hypothetical protein HZA78_00900 [Candidatus Schekmanbacteria bacterium]|nr:hypothetical protein [Candidatus Schekmanbacteria bacterium]